MHEVSAANSAAAFITAPLPQAMHQQQDRLYIRSLRQALLMMAVTLLVVCDECSNMANMLSPFKRTKPLQVLGKADVQVEGFLRRVRNACITAIHDGDRHLQHQPDSTLTAAAAAAVHIQYSVSSFFDSA
jgi:hypothetical protein